MSSIRRKLTEDSLDLFGDYVISSNGLKRLEYYQEFEVRKNDVTHTLLSSIYHCYSLPNVRFEVYYNPTVPYRFSCILLSTVHCTVL
jgi:hypothetical protein